MSKEEAIKMLKAKLECMTRDVSGRDSDCIDRRCDECSLNYEQGNMGEQKEWLRMSIEALKLQLRIEQIIKSTIKEYLDKDCDDVTELLLALSKDLCERIRKEK